MYTTMVGRVRMRPQANYWQKRSKAVGQAEVCQTIYGQKRSNHGIYCRAEIMDSRVLALTTRKPNG